MTGLGCEPPVAAHPIADLHVNFCSATEANLVSRNMFVHR